MTVLAIACTYICMYGSGETRLDMHNKKREGPCTLPLLSRNEADVIVVFLYARRS